MVGKDEVVSEQILHRVEEVAHSARLDIGDVGADLVIGLS